MMAQDRHGTVLFTIVNSAGEASDTRLLLESLRDFGGDMARHPFWVFDATVGALPVMALADLDGLDIEVIPLEVTDALRAYYFGTKVAASARAEELAGDAVRSLVFMASNVLVTRPPVLLELEGPFSAAVRPVHIQNVGLQVDQPVDPFWRGVFASVGVDDLEFTVESFVDHRRLRAYFNTHTFSVDPSLALMRKWLEHFTALVTDAEYQRVACPDVPHQVFLFQALLSALLVTRLDAQSIRLLPPDYNYPYNLQDGVPPDRRVAHLDDPICLTHEQRSINPDSITDIGLREPLRTWLAVRTG